VATSENEAQPIVGKAHFFGRSIAKRQRTRNGLGRFVKQPILIAAPRLIAPRVVDQLAMRNGIDPRRGICWKAIALPINERRS
jgi:hypothetical protein